VRNPGDILLLSTYELGHQPLLLASPLAFLKDAGFAPEALDLAVQPLDEEAVNKAELIAISVPMHTALRLGVEVAARVRKLNPAAHLAFYGLYAPLNRAFLLERGASSVLGGEFEAELVKLARRLAEETKPGATRLVVLDRLSFPVPDRASLPPLKKYAHLLHAGGERLVGYVEASRGCLHQCRHCPIPPVYNGRFFIVQKDTVLEDVRRQVAAGAQHITFGDPDFLNGPEHVLRIVRAMHGEHPELTFDLTAKIEHLLKHRALLPELRALGCLFIVSAVESLSERVLTILDKGHTRADVDEALALVSTAGITLRPSLLAFTPWTTLDDYLELVDWVEARGIIDHIDPIHLAIRLLIPPGSKLLELKETQAAIGPLAADQLTYLWDHPDPRMDALQRAAYATVEAAAAAAEDPRTTFFRVKALALAAAANRPLTVGSASHAPPGASHHARAPRLTEAWFC
jgi:radical SAM superfamily enzyme YgiQ (UPF0313 family)